MKLHVEGIEHRASQANYMHASAMQNWAHCNCVVLLLADWWCNVVGYHFALILPCQLQILLLHIRDSSVSMSPVGRS